MYKSVHAVYMKIEEFLSCLYSRLVDFDYFVVRYRLVEYYFMFSVIDIIIAVWYYIV